MPNRRRLVAQIQSLLKKQDALIQKAFLDAMNNRARSINLVELAAAIEGRDFDRALNIAGITRADMFMFDVALTQAYAAGGQTVPAAAPAFALSFGFDGRATRAEEWARVHVGGLVTEIVEEQRQQLREVIGQQIAEGVNPRKAAVQIAGQTLNGSRQGGFIGLSRPQMAYLETARKELAELDSNYFTRKLRDKRFDGLVRKAIKEGKALSQADIERVASRYSDRLLKHRADVIARTESITALRAGRREGVLQGVEAGSIAADSINRVWNATMDARTRPDHTTMNGKMVEGMNEPFVLPDGSQMLYPGDTSLGASASQTIQCRCYDEYVVDWLRG